MRIRGDRSRRQRWRHSSRNGSTALATAEATQLKENRGGSEVLENMRSLLSQPMESLSTVSQPTLSTPTDYSAIII